MKRWVSLIAMAAAFVSCTDAAGPAKEHLVAVPLGSVQQTIAGSYIVTVRDDITNVDNVATALAGEHRGVLGHVYRVALRGFAIENLSPAAVALVARDRRVARVEPDQVVKAMATQTGATWGLDRVDQLDLPLDGNYTYNVDGTGVSVYIIDTGVLLTHVDFGGRAHTGIDVVTPGGTANDCNGHGTHVAGTIGGTTYGVAKNVQLFAVRVLDCNGSGSTSNVIAGIDWVTANHASPAAAILALGSTFSAALNQAVANSVAAGVTYGVVAGASALDACNFSPASEPSAITVAATDITDKFASFSNFGPCVDINAPGVNITSDWIGSNTATITITGTSMGTAHVVGAIALYLSANPASTPAQVASALIGNAGVNKISGIPAGTPNLLVYTGFIAPPPPSSIAAFTYSCSGLSCTFDGTPSTGETGWSWTFGDGGTGTGSVVTHVYASGRARYTVTLNTTPAGPQSTASKTVRCRATPTAGCR